MTAIGSLCSGYGGLDLAVEEVFGAETVWHADLEEAPTKVLAARWPGVPNLGDLTRIDWHNVRPVDIFTAGYPCQPDSDAGKRLSQDDPRWIFPAIADAIGVLRPRLVVLENVRGHFVRGFRTVLGTLTELGYDAQWTLVRASDVGAPHRRLRLFILAQDANRAASGERWVAAPGQAQGGRARADAGRPDRVRAVADTGGVRRVGRQEVEPDRGSAPVRREAGDHAGDPSGSTAADADGGRREGGAQFNGSQVPNAADRDPLRGHTDGHPLPAWGSYEPAVRRWERVLGRPAPAPTELAPRGGQRLSPRFVEWMMGLPAGWVTDVPGISRNDQLKALGNGVVPQQAAAAIRSLLSASVVAA